MRAKPTDKQDTPPRTVGQEQTAFLRDWVALWQSELTALATDREVSEAWTRLLDFWSGFASTMLPASQVMTDHDDNEPSAPTNIHGSTRSPPGAAASGPRGDAIKRLERRVTELEKRLAAVERSR